MRFVMIILAIVFFLAFVMCFVGGIIQSFPYQLEALMVSWRAMLGSLLFGSAFVGVFYWVAISKDEEEE